MQLVYPSSLVCLLVLVVFPCATWAETVSITSYSMIFGKVPMTRNEMITVNKTIERPSEASSSDSFVVESGHTETVVEPTEPVIGKNQSDSPNNVQASTVASTSNQTASSNILSHTASSQNCSSVNVTYMQKIENYANMTKPDYIYLRFVGNFADLMNCSLSMANSSLTCQNFYRGMYCSMPFNVTTLESYFFTVYGFENTNSWNDNVFHSNLIKYNLYPFKLLSKTRFGYSNNVTVDQFVYDYQIPIYGFEVKLNTEDGQLIGPFGLNIKEVSCFNKLAFMLNEAKLIDRMRVVSYLTQKDLIQSFKFHFF